MPQLRRRVGWTSVVTVDIERSEGVRMCFVGRTKRSC